jgi:hypothetical protein
VVQGAHPVEQVRGEPGTGGKPGRRLRVRGVGVTDGGDNVGGDQVGDDA